MLQLFNNCSNMASLVCNSSYSGCFFTTDHPGGNDVRLWSRGVVRGVARWVPGAYSTNIEVPLQVDSHLTLPTHLGPGGCSHQNQFKFSSPESAWLQKCAILQMGSKGLSAHAAAILMIAQELNWFWMFQLTSWGELGLNWLLCQQKCTKSVSNHFKFVFTTSVTL